MNRSDIYARFIGNVESFQLDCEFNFPASGVTAIFGQSGSGKTSLLRCMAGLTKLPGGEFRLGQTVWQDHRLFLPPHKRDIGYVFQEANLFPHLSVRGNLNYAMKRAGSSPDGPSFIEVAELFGLTKLLDRATDRLSGGERQRVAIGRAILAKPKLLLMDEPLANLDSDRRREILPFLESLRRDLDLPIVYVTHQMNEIIRLADRIIVIDNGKVAASGSVEDVLSRLDLYPLTGRFDAGAVLNCRVVSHDNEDQLMELAFSGGTIWAPQQNLDIGNPVRIRVRARDIALSLTAPEQTSVLNIFRARVLECRESDGGRSDVALAVGETKLWASVTMRSMRELGLKEGTEAYAMIKSVAVDHHSMGKRNLQR